MHASATAEVSSERPVFPGTILPATVVIASLAVFIYWRTGVSMASEWWTEASHGLLVPPLVGYIVWLQWRSVKTVPARTESLGLVVLFLGCLLLIVGQLSSESFISRLSMVVTCVGLLWTFWGRGRVRALALPLLLSLTMIPIPLLIYNTVALPLQLLASAIAASLAQWFGIVVLREGNVIHLAQVSLGVAEACSGLRSLGSLLVMALLLGFVQCKSIRARLLLVGLAIPVAVAVNVFRVFGTAVLADYNVEYAMGFYHVFSGYVVFLTGVALMFAVSTAVAAWVDSK